jgi:para-aminobenzoate synthetase component 1
MHKLDTIPVSDLAELRNKLIVILDSNSSFFISDNRLNHKYDMIAGFSNLKKGSAMISDFNDLEKINSDNAKYYMGYLTYDLKNRIEDLSSTNHDGISWPELLFFEPEILFVIKNGSLDILGNCTPEKSRNYTRYLFSFDCNTGFNTLPELYPRTSKEEYLERVLKIKQHIKRGDLYEMNYCIEFSNTSLIDPYTTFAFLTSHSPAPFSAFVKYNHNFLLSASPERFLLKEDNNIISQPIKGTAPRNGYPNLDCENRNNLEKSLKERTENIMIADLVRNDLSRIALNDSVRVDELCGIYAYPHVYHMISTISARLGDISFLDIIKATFPMGSMTGAPKIKAMQLIEEYETVRRGLYSGTVGYIFPRMNFDFNVVIRSLQYNALTDYVSYMAGSAITAMADPVKEYEECLLKAYAINPQLNPSADA